MKKSNWIVAILLALAFALTACKPKELQCPKGEKIVDSDAGEKSCVKEEVKPKKAKKKAN